MANVEIMENSVVTRCRQMVESYQQWGVLEPGEVSIVHYGQIHWPSRGWMIIYTREAAE